MQGLLRLEKKSLAPSTRAKERQGDGGKNFRTDFLSWKILEVPLSQWDCQGVDNRRVLKVPVTPNQSQPRSGVRAQRPMGLWELFPQCGGNRPA